MAVFQGARVRVVAVPADAAGVRPRAVAPAQSVRGTRRVRPTGLFIAAIVAATMLGLVYLTQTLGSNAASSEIRSLTAQSEKLGNQLLNLAHLVQLNSDPEVITQRATKLGLKLLDDDVVVLTVP